jgi:hypothetical protein
MGLDVGQNGGISIDQHPAGLFHHDESANAEMLRVTSTWKVAPQIEIAKLVYKML